MWHIMTTCVICHVSDVNMDLINVDIGCHIMYPISWYQNIEIQTGNTLNHFFNSKIIIIHSSMVKKKKKLKRKGVQDAYYEGLIIIPFLNDFDLITSMLDIKRIQFLTHSFQSICNLCCCLF